jgi:hypothetical protein
MDGRGRLDITVPMTFSFDETCDVGKETGSPVSPDYGERGNEFSGEVSWVQIDLEKDDHDRLISPEERFQVAMARRRNEIGPASERASRIVVSTEQALSAGRPSRIPPRPDDLAATVNVDSRQQPSPLRP